MRDTYVDFGLLVGVDEGWQAFLCALFAGICSQENEHTNYSKRGRLSEVCSFKETSTSIGLTFEECLGG